MAGAATNSSYLKAQNYTFDIIKAVLCFGRKKCKSFEKSLNYSILCHKKRKLLFEAVNQT